MLDEGSGRFTLGPLTEVVAQHHTWRELAPLLEPGPRAALVAHERALRGEVIDAGVGRRRCPTSSSCRTSWRRGSRTTCWPTYHDVGAEFPLPADARTRSSTSSSRRSPRTASTTPSVELAVRQLVDAVDDGLQRPGRRRAPSRATRRRAAGARPGARPDAPSCRRRRRSAGWPGPGPAAARSVAGRGAAAGRFGALWLVAALGDALDDWPLDPAELGELAGELRWWWWDAHEPVTGWQLQLAVEAVHDGLAWAISARDAV